MSSQAGFEQVDETEVVRGRVARWCRVRFRTPDGTEHERDVVRHPGAVAVLPLHDDGTITFVRQYRAALDADCLEIPAGLRDVAGEQDDATARRELAEEAGLATDHLEPLAGFHNSPGFCDEQVAIFLATGLHTIDDDRQGVEELAMTVERHALRDALAMVADGRITDAKTIIGLSALALREAG